MTEECPPLRLGNAPKYRNRKLATRRATVRIAVNALHTEMSRIPGTLADSVASIAISTASTVDNLESTLGKKLRPWIVARAHPSGSQSRSCSRFGLASGGYLL